MRQILNGVRPSRDTFFWMGTSSRLDFRVSSVLLGWRLSFGVLVLSAGFSLPVLAAVSISSGQTSNMTCANGICAPTAKNAVLNVGDLENLLASGNVEVTTTGSGIQASDIVINEALAWSSTNTLALDAYQSVNVDATVSVTGLSGLSVATDDGGSGGMFTFGAKGNVTFVDLASVLTINDTSYVLMGTLSTLASAISADPSGAYALANSYDAQGDGTYSNSPIQTEFSGVFEGLGNTISHLSIKGSGGINGSLGLFGELSSGGQPGGVVNDIVLRSLRIRGSGGSVGGVVGFNIGAINGAFVSGSVDSEREQNAFGAIGMLAGANYGTITRSGALGTVSTSEHSGAGGLTGGGSGSITQSYADCKVTVGSNSNIGGLAGSSFGPVLQSYAKGTVTDNTASYAGGFTGESAENGAITQSYSTTAMKDVGHKNRDAGGLIGFDNISSNSSDYWDTSTSRMKKRNEGAGTPKNDPGITGLTTEQLQSGLPSGFDPTVWAEDPKINGGFPYLIANPPRKD
jgi:hypothetical protein